MTGEAEDTLTQAEREALLSEARSPLFWVGRFIPDEVMIDGERIPLRDLVFRYLSKGEHTEEEVKNAMAFSQRLERRIGEIESKIRYEEMTRSEAEGLLEEMLGLMRAVDELRERAGSAELRRQAMLSRVEEERRWMDFVRRLI